MVLAVDLWLYVGYASSRRATASQLDAVEAKIDSESQALARAEDALSRADVSEQNALVEFMNHRIAERTFGWSVLFDRLADLLPDDVRLLSLTPRFVTPTRPAVRRGAAPGERRPAAGSSGGCRSPCRAMPGVARRSSSWSTPFSPTPPSPIPTSAARRSRAARSSSASPSPTCRWRPRRWCRRSDVGTVEATPPDAGPVADGGEASAAGAGAEGRS